MRSRDASPRRYSPLIVLALFVAGAVALLALALVLRDALDPLKRAEAWYAYERQQRIAEELSTLDTLVAAGWRLLPLALVAGAGYVGLLALFNRLAARRFVEADKLIALQRAQRQQFPASLQTLAFHDSSRQERAMLPEPEYGEEEGEEEEARPAPAFAELLHNGTIAPGRPLVLGWSEGAALTGSWRDLYSAACSGLSGSGKSSTARYLIAQTALAGGKLAIIDPHGDDPAQSLALPLQPLAPAFVARPAVAPADVLAMLDLVLGELSRRKAGKGGRAPLVLVVDEFTSLMRGELAERVGGALETIALEARKFGIFSLVLGHTWLTARTGGNSALRDAFASAYVHRSKRQQARFLLPADLAAEAERLATGEALLYRTSGETCRVTIPHITSADLVEVGRMLTADHPTIERLRPTARPTPGPQDDPGDGAEYARSMPEVGQKYAAADAADLAAGSAKAPSAEAARVLALFLAGKEPAQIVAELHNGLTSKGGAQYQRALREVTAQLREAMATAARGEA